MSRPSVTLATSTPQLLHGFVDTHPLSARSTAGSPPPASPLAPVTKFLGIPYATAPRWSKPVHFPGSASALECTEFGPQPHQPANGAIERFWKNKTGHWLDRDFVGSDEENCLSVNVFGPTVAMERARLGGRKLPVFVWIYGGAFNTGNASAIRHDPTEFIRLAEKEGNEFIAVTGNYRVAMMGFVSHPDLAAVDPEGISGNYGYYDQLALLEWVHKHIGGLGGDPTRVACAGESAGAFAVSCLATSSHLLRSPYPLFTRAILQSGSPSTMGFSSAPYHAWDSLLKRYNLDDPALTAHERVAGLRKVDAEEMTAFGTEFGKLGGWGGTLQVGGLFEVHPEVRFAEGKFDKRITEWVLGCNGDEGTLFSGALGERRSSCSLTWRLTIAQLTAPGALEKYLAKFPADISELYPTPSSDVSLVEHPSSQILGTQVFLAPRDTLAASLHAASVTVRQFDFNALLPLMSVELAGFGAYHGIEIPFVFGTRTFWTEGSEQEKVSEEMMRRWSSIVVDGQGMGRGPAWAPWTETAPSVLVLGGEQGGVPTISTDRLGTLEQRRRDAWTALIRTGQPTSLSA